eukprot:g46693.t1
MCRPADTLVRARFARRMAPCEARTPAPARPVQTLSPCRGLETILVLMSPSPFFPYNGLVLLLDSWTLGLSNRAGF